MKLIITLSLLLSACALPGKPPRPLTVGECMEQRGGFSGFDAHESSYLALASCQAEVERRK